MHTARDQIMVMYNDIFQWFHDQPESLTQKEKMKYSTFIYRLI